MVTKYVNLAKVEAALRRHLAIPLGAGSPLQHQIDPLPLDRGIAKADEEEYVVI
jgi:hypothetical protein